MDVRSEIPYTATRLFAAKGFDGTSLEATAEAVGVRKPSLLYHFRRSKSCCGSRCSSSCSSAGTTCCRGC